MISKWLFQFSTQVHKRRELTFLNGLVQLDLHGRVRKLRRLATAFRVLQQSALLRLFGKFFQGIPGERFRPAIKQFPVDLLYSLAQNCVRSS